MLAAVLTLLCVQYAVGDIAFCPAGSFLEMGSGRCQSCPSGTYLQHGGQAGCDCASCSPCVPCPPGTASPSPGASSPLQCQRLCGLGSYWEVDSGQCQPCPLGFFLDELGQTGVQSKGHNPCKRCPLGQTTLVAGANSSVDCRAQCSLGHYFDAFQQTCVPCAKGFYLDQTGHVGRTSRGDNPCKSCPMGLTTTSNGSSSATQCVAICASGKFYDLDLSSCVRCPKGTFLDHSGEVGRSSSNVTPCISCPRGSTTPADGATSMAACSVSLTCASGTFLDAKEHRCERCPMGSYLNETNRLGCLAGEQHPCLPCPSGTTTYVLGAAAVRDCKVPCSKGYYFSIADSACRTCPVGTYVAYSGSVGLTACVSCTTGLTTEFSGSQSSSACQTKCSRGYFNNKNRNQCEACPKNTYLDREGTFAYSSTEVCRNCASGQVTSGTASTSSSACTTQSSGGGGSSRGGGCFPSQARVRLEDGREVSLGQLKPDQAVLAVDHHQRPVYSPVLLFLHRFTDQATRYVEVWLEGRERPLTLTPNHLLFVWGGGDWSSLLASHLTPGMQLGFLSPGNASVLPSTVTHTRMLSLTEGLAPMTEHGTIVVDDVIASCYADHHNHDEAHVAMTPFRVGYKLGAWLGLTNPEAESKLEGVHWSARLMMKITCALRDHPWCSAGWNSEANMSVPLSALLSFV